MFLLLREVTAGPGRFPERALTVLLLGPSMNLVFAYAAMSIPLYRPARVTPPMLLATVAAIGASSVVALTVFRPLRRITHPYYAAVISTVFFALTAGWGPIAMASPGPVR